MASDIPRFPLSSWGDRITPGAGTTKTDDRSGEDGEGGSMRLLLIGAPGAGKGTQALRLAEHFGITHISSGDLLRRHVTDGTAFGRQVQEYVARGDLVPDQMVLDMLRKPIVEASASGGYVLDGFPRTVEQAELAYGTARELGVAVQLAAYLDVGRDELVRRLMARGRGSDDTADVIEHRLEIYEAKTRPMIEYYAHRERLVTVNGARPADEVSWSLVVQLQKHQKALAKLQAESTTPGR